MTGLFARHTPSTMGSDEFVAAFGDIYEHSAWLAEAAWKRGLDSSHDSIDNLHRLMADILLSADHQTQLDLINAHPDLAGKAAIRGELTEASTSEQAGAGISECNEEEFSRFTRLNSAYKEKFGFPFIMAVKGSNRYQILDAFEKRIHNSPDEEFERALQEINKIALFRLNDM